MTALSYC